MRVAEDQQSGGMHPPRLAFGDGHACACMSGVCMHVWLSHIRTLVVVQAFMYSRAQEAAMHRARSTEASGSLGALQRALAWARNGLWGLFGLGIERQGPEEGGPLATGAAQSWAGRSSEGAAGMLGSESESDAEGAGAPTEARGSPLAAEEESSAATAAGGGGSDAGSVGPVGDAAAEAEVGEPTAGEEGDDAGGKHVGH